VNTTATIQEAISARPTTQKIPPAYSPALDLAKPTGRKPAAVIGNAVEVQAKVDQPRIVDGSVSEFVETFAEALIIVLAVSFLSLGWRTGIVVALSVPLVLAIVLLVMYAGGLVLHRITLGALIIALGLLVDDAIITIEMMVVKALFSQNASK
jgi:multidrug efflux pump subunit AcrB